MSLDSLDHQFAEVERFVPDLRIERMLDGSRGW
jgi:hypothetical protein